MPLEIVIQSLEIVIFLGLDLIYFWLTELFTSLLQILLFYFPFLKHILSGKSCLSTKIKNYRIKLF